MIKSKFVEQPEEGNWKEFYKVFNGEILIGTLEYKAEKDRYDNHVSLIDINGYKFRMVHHSKPYHCSQRCTIYAGRGKFIKVRMNSSNNDTVATTINIAGYYVSWGDGDNLGVTTPENKPEIPELQTITEDDFFAVILTVLNFIQNHAEPDQFWEIKEVIKPEIAKT